MHLEVSSGKRAYGLTDAEMDALTDALTFSNPAYERAARYHRGRVTRIPPELRYYHAGRDEGGIYIDFPRGLDLEEAIGRRVGEGDTVAMRTSKPLAEYPDFALELRPIQRAAKEAYMESVGRAMPYKPARSIVSLPTGKGKTILALSIAKDLRTKALVLVHKDDLVRGWQRDVDLCFGGKVRPGLIKAGSREVGEQVTIATVQTLHRMSEEEFGALRSRFGLVVQDEVHHCGLNMFNVAGRFDAAYRLGLSATPKRSDGLDFAFSLFFGGVCYEYKAGRDDEDICNVRVEVLDSGYRYRPALLDGEVVNLFDVHGGAARGRAVPLDSIPYDERPRVPFSAVDSGAVLSPKTMARVCQKVLEHCRMGHSCLMLFTQKEHVDAYFRYLRLYYPEGRMMKYYGDSREGAEALLSRAESGSARVTLATYAKATEGTNVKAWEVLFLVSSMNNEKNVEQATGRIRRRKEGKLDPVVVYDVRYPMCYSLDRHYATRRRAYESLGYEVHDPAEKKGEGPKGLFDKRLGT